MDEQWLFLIRIVPECSIEMGDGIEELGRVSNNSTSILATARAGRALLRGRLDLRGFASRQRSQQTGPQDIFAAPRRQRCQPREKALLGYQVIRVALSSLPCGFHALWTREITGERYPPGMRRRHQAVEATRYKGDRGQRRGRKMRKDMSQDLCLGISNRELYTFQEHDVPLGKSSIDRRGLFGDATTLKPISLCFLGDGVKEFSY